MSDKLKKDMKTLRWIGARIRGQRGHLAWLTVSNILGAVLSVGLALVSKGLVDGAARGSFRSFALCLAALLTIVSVQMLLSFIDSVVSENMIEHLQVHFQDEMLGIYLSRDYQKIAAYHSGELLNRLFSDVGIVVNGAISLLPSAVFMVIRLIAAAAVLLVIAPAFTVLFLVVGVVLTSLMILMKERFQHLHKEMQEAAGRVRSFLQEIMSSIIVVKAYSAENRVRNRVLEGQERYRLIRRKRWKIGLAGSTGIDLIFNAGYFGAMIWGCLGILRRTLTYGSLTAMLQLVGQIQAPFAGFSGMITSCYEVLASAERLMEITEMPESGAEESGIKGETETHDTSGWHKETKQEMDPLLIGRNGTATEKRMDRADRTETFAFESICLDNVSFDYGREPVLKDLSVRINKGEIVAITGPSGCGKSTLLMLLMGAYKPDQGSVRIVGGQVDRLNAEVDHKHDEEIAEKNDAWIDEKNDAWIDGGSADKTAPTGFYAYVPQGNYLFSGSLRDNVTFFNKEVSDELIWQALKIACAEAFVRELPEGLDTLLGEKGHGLSEGQMQRLAIARAIYSGAPVLLLDEVTSALDAKTEARVLENIRNLKDRTCLIVTHKLKALSICDQRLEMGESEE